MKLTPNDMYILSKYQKEELLRTPSVRIATTIYADPSAVSSLKRKLREEEEKNEKNNIS